MKKVSPTRKITSGKIIYQIAFVPNPSYRGGRLNLFSGDLQARIRRQNVPESRVAYFDDRLSRTEEINVDYGVRSLSFRLMTAGRDTITYCKEFRNFGFCVEYPAQLPIGGPPPDLQPADETAVIAGLRCRKAEYQGSRHVLVWYTEEFEIAKPTFAMLQLEGVPGLILQTRDIAGSDKVDAVQQVTITELCFEAPPPEIFSVPAKYRRFDTIDDARAEDRKILNAKSDEELRLRPLEVDELDMFVGEWLFETPEDRIQVEIVRSGENEFQFRTRVLSAPADAVGRITDEKAYMKGRLLMVEDPPNYRLYKLAADHQSLITIDNELFTFTRR